MSMICPSCHRLGDATAKFCHHCSARLVRVKCACGYLFRSEDNFCRMCGRPTPQHILEAMRREVTI